MALFKSKESATPTMAPAAAGTTTEVGSAASECMRIGQLLVDGEHLSAEHLAVALREANGDAIAFTDIVVARFGTSRAAAVTAIGAVWNIEVADTRTIELQPHIVTRLSEPLAREHCVIAIGEHQGALVVLTAEPSPQRRQVIEQAAKARVVWMAADPATIRNLIERNYRADADIDRLVQVFDLTAAQQRGVDQATDVDLDDQAPVVQLVNRIISQAMRDRTSDIHVEPLDDRLRIRFRIDGHLVEAFSLPIGAHPPLTSRLKIMSGMNIVEKRRPQDGQFSTVIDGKDIDVRVGSVSTLFGEKIVMRILDKRRSMIGLDQLGFPRETYLHYSKMVHSPFGMVICAGPTGAGKTTTLYATLQEINSLGKNITTIEDPVEYVFPGINQIQTNEQAGLTFATGLRAILRQDPDVILVGEVRDADTARIAIQSALTGHFVLSSLHGTDSVAALHRFLDMGIEAFLIASSVVGVIGQRLLRRICDSCKEPYLPPPDELAAFKQHSGGSDKTHFFRGAGCNFCAGTGYRDRIGVYELLRVTPELRRLIVGWATTEELRRLAVAQGMRTMLREAMALVENDVTTIPEVIRTLFAN
ncbi:MAG: GspE/PulE family protein [Actinomycetota bacterium]|jgi:type IV pilus assembly protein PilB